MLKQILLHMIFIFTLFTSTVSAQADLSFAVDIPYRFGQEAAVPAGGTINALFRLENGGLTDRSVDLTVMLPDGLIPLELPSGWQIANNRLTGRVDLAGGYDHWFELIRFQSNLPAGNHTLAVTLLSGNTTWVETIAFSTQERDTAERQGKLALSSVRLPLDREGNADLRVADNTITLRDRIWDYYKSVLRGKGALNEAAEYSHPLTFMGLTFDNPQGESKLLTVSAQLLDKVTKRPVPGLYTPAASTEDAHTTGFSEQVERTVAFVALNGVEQQRLTLPLYADEDHLNGGEYELQITVTEADHTLFVHELPIRVIAANTRAAWVTGTALIIVLIGLALLFRYGRRMLAGLKTRWLITIALFGSASFAVVNVPATLLNDVLHVILGPFAFLATGMFNGVIYYMLLAALVLLIPRPGAVLLMIAVRLILSMLIFGHATPVSFLIQGSQAFILETAFYLAGFTRLKSADLADEPDMFETGRWQLLLLALTAGVADSLSSFINIHVISLLYRLFYADWYIALTVIINGFCYPALGAGCGVLLGNKLKKVGCD